MSTQNLTEEMKNHSAWSIFMGVVTAALGVFLIVYPLATAAITTVSAGLGIDLRRYRPVCFRASLADDWKLFPEGSFERALRDLRYRVGVLSHRRRGSADRSSWNTSSDPGGTTRPRRHSN